MGAERGVGRHDKGKVKVNASVNQSENRECANLDEHDLGGLHVLRKDVGNYGKMYDVKQWGSR